MSVWVCLPSARAVAQVNERMDKWRAQGYKVALWRDKVRAVDETDADTYPRCDMLALGVTYPGYPQAANQLIANVFGTDPACDWVVAAGDDMDPDPVTDQVIIAHECSDHFRNLHIEATGETINVHPTFGVMQPTGDRWGDKGGAYVDRVAGSAWIGREFARRINGGHGPFWPEYFHMGADEELQHVAIALGVFWQRPDLIQYHDHWGRPKPPQAIGHKSNMPAFLARANSPEHWREYKALLATRQAAGFPGSECIV